MKLSLAVVVFAVFACGAPAPAPVASATMSAADRPGAHCRVSVTKTEGCDAAQVEALIAPVRSRLEHCRGTSGGKVAIRIRDAAGRLSFDVEDVTSLDPTERQCVLDALATINADESGTAWAGGAGVPPSGFTSLITVEW